MLRCVAFETRHKPTVSALVPILWETDLSAGQPEVGICSRDTAYSGGMATVDENCRIIQVSLSVWIETPALWCWGPSRSGLSQTRCMGTAVHLLTAFLKGFLVVIVVYGNGGCQEQAPTTTANYLAGSLLIALYKRYPEARQKADKKVGHWIILAAWLSFGWLVPRDISGWVGTYSVRVLQTKLLWFMCHLSVMLPAHPHV